MKPKLLSCLFLLIGLHCYSHAGTSAADTSRLVKHKNQYSKLAAEYHKRDELYKRWKPEYDNCTFTYQYTIAQRLKKYPYSKAAKILAVSYLYYLEPDPSQFSDTLHPTKTFTYKEKQQQKGLVIIKNKLDYSTLLEYKILNQDQINQLTNIIFNTDYQKKMGYITSHLRSCFEPRNSLIFLNKKGKVIDHIDICFHCHDYSSQSNNIGIGIICNQKYDILKRFFISAGIKYVKQGVNE